MTNFLLILLALAAGYLLRKTGKVTAEASRGVSVWVLYVALPAVALKYLPGVVWSASSLLPLAMPLVVWAGAWLFITALAPRFGWDRSQKTALVLTAGLANTSFVGFPLIQAYYGETGLPIGILCDQATFLLLSTLGVTVASRLVGGEGGRRSLGALVKSVAVFPPFLACVAALVLPNFVDLAPAEPLLSALGATLAPLALFSVGLQLRFGDFRSTWKSLVAGLGYKLFLAPALVLALVWATGIRGLAGQIPVFESAMAPMITAAVVAAEYKASPRLANAMVGFGIPLSLVTTLFWWWAAGFLA